MKRVKTNYNIHMLLLVVTVKMSAVWLQALSDDLLSEGGQTLPVATRPSGHKKGFFRPWS